MDVEDTGMPDITQQMLDHQGKMAQENAEKLKAILDVIIFLWEAEHFPPRSQK